MKSNPNQLLAPPDFKAHWNETISDEDYHADKTSIGSSQIRRFIDSPAGFIYDYRSEREQEERECFREGKMIHMAILENEKFLKTYVVMPEFMGLTQDGKMSAQSKAAREKRGEWLMSLPVGTKVCTQDEIEMITGIAESIMRHPQGEALIKNGKPEVAGYFRDPETGLRIRIKPDLLHVSGEAMIDLKSAKTTKRIQFGSAAFQHRYDLQLFTYMEGARIITGKMPDIVTIIAVEKEPPYEPAIYYVTKEQLTQAEHDYRTTLRKLKSCIESNSWPHRQTQIEPLHVPEWFIHQATVEMDMF